MRIKLNIRQKISLFVLTSSILLYTVAIGYITVTVRQSMLEDAFVKAQLTARVSADKIEKEFERDLALTRTLGQAYSIYQELPTEFWQDLFKRMYKPILEVNKHVYSIWDSWELYGFVPDYDKDYGRFCITLWRENDEIKDNINFRSLDGDPDKYLLNKLLNKDMYWDPYLDEASLEDKDDIFLMTTIASPIQVDGKFMGIIGLDISLESLQKTVAAIEPVEGSFAFLVSSNFTVAAHHDPALIYTPLDSIMPTDFKEENLSEVISKGLEHSFIRTDSTGHKYYITFAPIQAGNSPYYWSIALCVPLDILTERANSSLFISLGVGAIGLLVLVIVLMTVANSVTRPIRRITNSLNRLSQGEIADDLLLNLNTGDEIEDMANSLNLSIEGLKNKREFANNIGEGKIDSTLTLLGEDDILGQSLLNMRDSLRKANIEEEKRIIEDNKRTWANEGFALFADIMRANSDDLETLTDKVLQEIVKYVKGNQGALFLVKDDNHELYLEAVSVYAAERKKYKETKLMMGEGLIGASAVQRETIVLTEIPDNFVSITSELGEPNPKCIAIVPLKQDTETLGVIEVASYSILEPHEIEFLERISESLAATIATTRINEKTRMLLEQSQQQAEELLTQEEEMRQNMEELLATQEEMSRKEKEMSWTMEAIGGLGLLLEYDFNGHILNANNLVVDKFHYPKDDLLGKHHSFLFANKQMTDSEEYTKFWDKMYQGTSVETSITKRSKLNEQSEFRVYCHPVFDDAGRPLKIVEIGFDITEFCKKKK